MAFDQPLAFRSEHADFPGGGNAAVRLEIIAAQPHLAAPGAHADELAQLEAPEAFGESLAVGGRFLVA